MLWERERKATSSSIKTPQEPLDSHDHTETAQLSLWKRPAETEALKPAADSRTTALLSHKGDTSNYATFSHSSLWRQNANSTRHKLALIYMSKRTVLLLYMLMIHRHQHNSLTTETLCLHQTLAWFSLPRWKRSTHTCSILCILSMFIEIHGNA